MTARTHDTAALALLLAATLAWPPAQLTAGTALAALIANQLGGIAPDIDQPTAPLWRNLPIGRYAGRVFGVLVGGHRFLCHSLLGIIAFAVGSKLLIELLQPILPPIDTGFVWFAFLIGVVSHLIMDTLTKEGVPWLLPLPFKFGFPPVRAWRVTTGKKAELFIILPILVTSIVWLCSVQADTLTALVRTITN